MSPTIKFLIGLAATLLMGWLYHGPLGHGEAFIEQAETAARQAVAATEVPGIEVRLGRDPLSRTATLSGPADPFQREGQGELKGLNDIVAETKGVAGIRWMDEPEDGGVGLPLLIEALIGIVLGYVVGLGLGWLLFGRPKRESFLG